MTGPGLYAIAFAAGMVSFLSPCVLPLLPGYLSYISGSSVDDLRNSTSRRRQVLLTTILFVLGFSLIFSLLGSAFGLLGGLLVEYRSAVERAAGGFIILMGAFMIGFLKLPTLQREVRWLPKNGRWGALGAFPLGMAFAVGWTPCMGPILASISMLALNSPERGAPLLLAYSLGLGVPFIASGLLFSRLTGTLDWFKRHSVLIHKISGALLMIIGVLLLTGVWASMVAPLQSYFRLPI